MACSSVELHAIYFLWANVFYVLILPFFTAFLLHIVTQDKMVDKVEHKHTYSSKKDCNLTSVVVYT